MDAKPSWRINRQRFRYPNGEVKSDRLLVILFRCYSDPFLASRIAHLEAQLAKRDKELEEARQRIRELEQQIQRYQLQLRQK